MRRGQRSAHRWMAYGMAGAIALVFALAWALAQKRGDLPPPERLAPAADRAGAGGAQ